MKNMMVKQLLGVVLAGLLFAVMPATLLAADYSTDTTPANGTFSDTLDKKKIYDKHHVLLADGAVTLVQNDDGAYLESGSIHRNAQSGILKSHYEYFESAMLELDADLPEGTSIDLYMLTVDSNASFDNCQAGVCTRIWTKVEPGEKIDLGSFFLNEPSFSSGNSLRWKAVLHTSDTDVTPILNAVEVTYYQAAQRTGQLTLPQNVYGVNRTSGATITTTIIGKGFQDGKEEVYLKNLLGATTVQYVNATTLIATFPIADLSAGSYTMAVRNTETGRVALTDINGYDVKNQYHGDKDPEHLRLILKWYAPEISSLSPETVTYAAGGTITITGKYFSYGTKVAINDSELPSESVTVVSENKITVDLTSGIITQYNFPRDTNLTITLTTPDYQTVSTTGLVID